MKKAIDIFLFYLPPAMIKCKISKKSFKYPNTTLDTISDPSKRIRTECVFAHESLMITEIDDVTKRVSVKVLRLPTPPRLRPIHIPYYMVDQQRKRPLPETRRRVERQLQQRIEERQRDNFLAVHHPLDNNNKPTATSDLIPPRSPTSSSSSYYPYSSSYSTRSAAPSSQRKLGAIVRWVSSCLSRALHIRGGGKQQKGTLTLEKEVKVVCSTYFGKKRNPSSSRAIAALQFAGSDVFMSSYGQAKAQGTKYPNVLFTF